MLYETVPISVLTVEELTSAPKSIAELSHAVVSNCGTTKDSRVSVGVIVSNSPAFGTSIVKNKSGVAVMFA